MELTDNNRSIFRLIVLALAALILIIPVVAVAVSGTAGLSAKSTTLRLTGLFAFTLIFLNILSGSLARYFYKIFPPKRVSLVHRITGLSGLLLALLHGVLVVAFKYLSGYSAIWVLGPIALVLLAVAAGAALNMKRLPRLWRNIHRVNYLVFILVYIKAFAIGTDISSRGSQYLIMKIMFGIYLAVFLMVMLLKSYELTSKRAKSSPP